RQRPARPTLFPYTTLFRSDEVKPWVVAKQAGQEQQLQEICTMGLNLFRQLLVYIKPVVPRLARQAEEFLGVAPLSWKDAAQPLLDRKSTRLNSSHVKISYA